MAADNRDPSCAEIDQWLESIEPNPEDARDATHNRRIIAAAKAVDVAETERTPIAYQHLDR
jgi:hypothetical protein